MQFQPKTEKQLAEQNLIPKGIYPFEVSTAEAKRSKKGNDMIEIELRVFMPDGSEHALRDWLMAAMGFKLFHFCAYAGLSTQYEAGTLTSHDCVGKSGFLEIVIQEDKTGQYGPQNSVKDYCRPEFKKGAAPAAPTDAQLANQVAPSGSKDTEDVPF